MSYKLLLDGDKTEASKWVPYAKNKLAQLKSIAVQTSTSSPVKGVLVRVSVYSGIDEIYIKAEPPVAVGIFAAIPASDSSVNGWSEPFTDQDGNPINAPLGSVTPFSGTQYGRETIYGYANDAWREYRYPDFSTSFPSGIVYGNLDWSNGKETLTWDGVTGRHGGEAFWYGSYLNAPYDPSELLPGIQVTDGELNAEVSVQNITKRDTTKDGTQLSHYAYESAFSGNIYRGGELLVSISSGGVMGTSIFIDSVGKRWLQAIIATVTAYGITKESYWVAPMDDLSAGVSTDLTTYYTTAAAALQGIPTAYNPKTNTQPWAFNGSGTEAQVAIRKYLGNNESGEGTDYRLKINITDGAGDYPTAVLTKVEETYNNTHTGSGPATTINVRNIEEGPINYDCDQGGRLRYTQQNVDADVSGYTIIAIDYVGDKEVFAAISTRLYAKEVRIKDNTIAKTQGSTCANIISISRSVQNENIVNDTLVYLWFSEDPGTQIPFDSYGYRKTKNVDYYPGKPESENSVHQVSGGYDAQQASIYYMDVRHRICIMDTFTNYVPVKTYDSPADYTLSAFTEALNLTLYVGQYSYPIFTETFSYPATTGTDSNGPGNIDINTGYTPEGTSTVTLTADWHPIEWTPVSLSSVIIGDILYVMTSVPELMFEIRGVYAASTPWNQRRGFFNKLMRFNINGTTIEELDVTDVESLTPIGTTPRYMPIGVLNIQRSKLY